MDQKTGVSEQVEPRSNARAGLQRGEGELRVLHDTAKIAGCSGNIVHAIQLCAMRSADGSSRSKVNWRADIAGMLAVASIE